MIGESSGNEIYSTKINPQPSPLRRVNDDLLVHCSLSAPSVLWKLLIRNRDSFLTEPRALLTSTLR